MQDSLDRSLVDSEVMTRACERFSLPTGGTLCTKIERLSGYFDKLNEDEELYSCGNCGGEIPGELAWCPFCGDEDQDEPAENSDGGIVVIDATTLDESVAQIKGAEKAAAVGVWNLGEALRQNFDGQFWAQRLTKKGKQKYKTVNEFWTAELGYGHSYSYKLIRIAREFTYEQAEGLSGRQLSLILKAGRGQRDGLIDDARKGKSHGELAAQIEDADAPRIGELAEGATPKDDRVTVSYEPKKRRVQMLAFPEGGGQPVPATKDHICIGGAVFTDVELDNHVMHIEIAPNPDDQIEMAIRFKKL